MFVKIMFLNKHNFFKKQKFVCLKKKLFMENNRNISGSCCKYFCTDQSFFPVW